MRVTVLGAGVVGACIAYYLCGKGIAPLVVERHEVAGAASGKAGGFLAADWCRGSALDPMARLSFDLHRDLAHAGLGDWGYRPVDTWSVIAGQVAGLDRFRRETPPAWLSHAACAVHGRLGGPDTTAQVDPRAFTEAVLAAALARGARLVHAEARGIEVDPAGIRVRAVLAGEERIETDAVVVAMGPWSILACRWLPLPALHGLKGHSLVLRPHAPVGADALFVEMIDASGERASPEVYPRADGTVYVSGVSEDAHLPVDPAAVAPMAGALERLASMAAIVSPHLAGAEALRTQACFRPVAADALPLVGPVPGIEGAFVATGHNCWGILNAPATGLAMAELITNGETRSLDLHAYDPARLPVLPAAALGVA